MAAKGSGQGQRCLCEHACVCVCACLRLRARLFARSCLSARAWARSPVERLIAKTLPMHCSNDCP
eukprot:14386118-Alexandrium_andersonii.AAC.1